MSGHSFSDLAQFEPPHAQLVDPSDQLRHFHRAAGQLVDRQSPAAKRLLQFGLARLQFGNFLLQPLELALFVEREAALVVAGGPFLDRDRPAFRVVPRPELGVAQLFPFEVFVLVPGKVSDPSFAFEYQQMIHDFVHEIAVV